MPGRAHSFLAGPRGIRTLHVAFGPRAAPRRGENAHPVDGIDHAVAAGLAARLLAELADPDSSSPVAIESLALATLDAATRWPDPPEPDARWLAWSREHLDAGGDPALEPLAARAGVHRAHLARSFAARFGLSVGEYHRRLRLAAAAEMLAERRPVSAVAQSTGFADQAHLTRWFGRVLGVTPAQYARSLADAPARRAPPPVISVRAIGPDAGTPIEVAHGVAEPALGEAPPTGRGCWPNR